MHTVSKCVVLSGESKAKKDERYASSSAAILLRRVHVEGKERALSRSNIYILHDNILCNNNYKYNSIL